jgi:hypothetical protein
LAFVALLGAANPANADPVRGICDRNAAVQKPILTQLPGVTCDQVTPEQLIGIKDLWIIYPDPFLKSTDLLGLSGLKKLAIWIYWKTEPGNFGDGFFSGTPNLEELTFGDGTTRNISKETFRGLTKLRTLDTGTISISQPSSDLFSLLTNIETIKTNFDQDVPVGIFDNLTRLKKITVEGCNRNGFSTFCSIPKDILKNVRPGVSASFGGFNNIPGSGGYRKVLVNTPWVVQGSADGEGHSYSCNQTLIDEAVENSKAAIANASAVCNWIGGTTNPVLTGTNCQGWLGSVFIDLTATASFEMNCRL